MYTISLLETNRPQDVEAAARWRGAGATREHLPLLLLATLLVGVVAFRAPAVFDDRTWYDETAVLLQSRAIHLSPWPATFKRADVMPDLSPGDVLSFVRVGPYPPGVPMLVYLFGHTDNPVRSLRWLVFFAGLALVALSYAVARSAGDGWLALVAATYVASSTVLTHASQQIKWTALAPLGALLAAFLVLRSPVGEADVEPPPRRVRVRWAYILTLAVLLHTHYFCLWVIAGHLLYALVWERPRIVRTIRELAVALVCVMPWYAFALLAQLAFVRRHFQILAHRAVDAWNAPITVGSAARALGYDALVGIGVQPSSYPGRYLALLLLPAIGGLTLALRSRRPERRRLALLASACLGVAALAHTVYAAKVGNVVPLQPAYLSPWMPLTMIAVVIGVTELRQRWLRMVTVLLLVGASTVTVLMNPRFPAIVESNLPRDYAALCEAATAPASPDAALVHVSDFQAKLLNLGCRLDAHQAIGDAGMRALPASAGRALVVMPAGGAFDVPRGWRASGHARQVANVMLAEYERDPAFHADADHRAWSAAP